MKTVEQIIGKINLTIENCTNGALNPDRAQHLRRDDLVVRKQLLLLRDFIVDECKHGDGILATNNGLVCPRCRAPMEGVA